MSVSGQVKSFGKKFPRLGFKAISVRAHPKIGSVLSYTFFIWEDNLHFKHFDQDLADHPEYSLLVHKDSAAMSFFKSANRESETPESVLWKRIGMKASQFLNSPTRQLKATKL